MPLLMLPTISVLLLTLPLLSHAQIYDDTDSNNSETEGATLTIIIVAALALFFFVVYIKRMRRQQASNTSVAPNGSAYWQGSSFGGSGSGDSPSGRGVRTARMQESGEEELPKYTKDVPLDSIPLPSVPPPTYDPHPSDVSRLV